MRLQIFATGLDGQLRSKIPNQQDLYFAQQYRGTYRQTPPYPIEGYGLDHEVNQAIEATLWGEGEDVLDDISKAKHAIDLLQIYVSQKTFEIVELTSGADIAKLQGILLGYDVSLNYYYSLIWEPLIEEIHYGFAVDSESGSWMTKYEPLIRVIKEFFRAKLNENGLFSSFADADLFLRTIKVLEGIQKGMWPESFHHGLLDEYSVIGVYLVSRPVNGL